MSRNRVLAAIVVVAGLAALILLRKGGGEAADAEPNPTAIITTAPVRSQRIEDVVSLYGTVQADPAGSLTVAAPKTVIVQRVLVRPGETVAKGQVLAEIAGAPTANLAYTQAAAAVHFAETDLVRVQRLFEERLAANDQLSAAKKTLADARSALEAQQQAGGAPGKRTLSAPAAGVIITVSAAAGDHVAQDAALMVLSPAGHATVKLALEASQTAVRAGQAATLRPVFGGPSIRSTIAMVGRAADPATKTLEAVVLLSDAALPIGSAVQGDVVTGARAGLAVPRAAVVFDETGAHLFVVEGGKARRVFVTVGRDMGDAIEVAGAVPAGATVAVEGAYELQDGLAVKVRGR